MSAKIDILSNLLDFLPFSVQTKGLEESETPAEDKVL